MAGPGPAGQLWVQPAREPATLLMDFVRGLSELGQTCETIHGIQEGYWYSGEEDRAVLTPHVGD